METNSRERCIRCLGKMEHIGREEIQLGKAGFFLGSLGHLMSGALEVEVFVCSECAKIEFYRASESDI